MDPEPFKKPNYPIYMKKSALLAFLLLFSAVLFGQNSITLCEKYDEHGTPTGLYNAWDIEPTGGYVYIMYSSDQPLPATGLTMQFDTYDSPKGTYNFLKKIDLAPVAGKNWVVYDNKFTLPGDYRIQVMQGSSVLATAYTNIKVKTTTNAATTTTDRDPDDTYYYEDSQIRIGTSATTEGVLSGESTVFNLPPSGSIDLTILLENPDPLGTEVLYIDLYDGANNLVDEYEIKVDPKWDWVKFKQNFTKKGGYILDIYSGSDVFINTATLTIE